MRVIKAGATYTVHINTTAADGSAVDADSTPTVAVYKNGVVDAAFTITVTKIATGCYIGSGTVPAYTIGDSFAALVSATVVSKACSAWKELCVVDTKYASDVDSHLSNGVNFTQMNGESITPDTGLAQEDTLTTVQGLVNQVKTAVDTANSAVAAVQAVADTTNGTVAAVKTVTDVLNGMIDSGAFKSAVYVNMPYVAGPGSKPVTFGPVYKRGTVIPVEGMEVIIYPTADCTGEPKDRKFTDETGCIASVLNSGTYYVRMRKDGIVSPETIVFTVV